MGSNKHQKPKDRPKDAVPTRRPKRKGSIKNAVEPDFKNHQDQFFALMSGAEMPPPPESTMSDEQCRAEARRMREDRARGERVANTTAMVFRELLRRGVYVLDEREIPTKDFSLDLGGFKTRKATCVRRLTRPEIEALARQRAKELVRVQMQRPDFRRV